MSLLVNENRQLSGARDQAVMPAWTANTLDANLVEFRSVQVASMPMQQVASGKYGNKSRGTSSVHVYHQPFTYRRLVFKCEKCLNLLSHKSFCMQL